MLGRESFQEYDDALFEVLSPFYKNVLKSKFHKYNRVYGNIEVNTDKRSKHDVSNMIYDEYSFDVINNSKRGLFTKTVKFTDLYYKKIRVSDSDIDKGKFDGIGEYVYSVILMGFNLDEKLKVGKRYWVDERLFKDLSGKFEFRESILDEINEKGKRTGFHPEIKGKGKGDDVKRERLEENKRKWDSGIFSKYEFFLREEDMDYLLKGIFEDKIEKERIRVWCDGEDIGEDESEDMREENDVEDGDGMEGVEIDFFSEPLGIKEIKRVKPCAFSEEVILGLDEGCNWAGYCEDGMRLDGNGRTVLRFDKEGFPLEQDEERQEIIQIWETF